MQTHLHLKEKYIWHLMFVFPCGTVLKDWLDARQVLRRAIYLEGSTRGTLFHYMDSYTHMFFKLILYSTQSGDWCCPLCMLDEASLHLWAHLKVPPSTHKQTTHPLNTHPQMVFFFVFPCLDRGRDQGMSLIFGIGGRWSPLRLVCEGRAYDMNSRTDTLFSHYTLFPFYD